MPGPTRLKRTGELKPPPSQTGFNKIDLPTEEVAGGFLRIHRAAHGVKYFSRLGMSRFDHPKGCGALCLGRSLRVCMQEVWGDFWDAHYRILEGRPSIRGESVM
jgi:hypothetical protein